MSGLGKCFCLPQIEVSDSDKYLFRIFVSDSSLCQTYICACVSQMSARLRHQTDNCCARHQTDISVRVKCLFQIKFVWITNFALYELITVAEKTIKVMDWAK